MAQWTADATHFGADSITHTADGYHYHGGGGGGSGKGKGKGKGKKKGYQSWGAELGRRIRDRIHQEDEWILKFIREFLEKQG